MNLAGLIKNNITQELVSTMLRSTLFSAYARVVGFSQVDPMALVVECCVGKNGFAQTLTAKILYPTTAQIQVAFKPMIGDKVLVIGLQAYSKNMFESPVTLTENEVNDVQHYTILGCVAIPLNIESAKAPIKITTEIDTTTSKPFVSVGSSVLSGDDPVVRWSELKTVLQSLWTAYNYHMHSNGGQSIPSNPWMLSYDPDDPPHHDDPPSAAPSFADLASDVLKVTPSVGV